MSVIFASCAIITLENNASPSLPAAIHSQTAGEGLKGPMLNYVQGPAIVLWRQCKCSRSNYSRFWRRWRLFSAQTYSCLFWTDGPLRALCVANTTLLPVTFITPSLSLSDHLISPHTRRPWIAWSVTWRIARRRLSRASDVSLECHAFADGLAQFHHRRRPLPTPLPAAAEARAMVRRIPRLSIDDLNGNICDKKWMRFDRRTPTSALRLTDNDNIVTGFLVCGGAIHKMCAQFQWRIQKFLRREGNVSAPSYFIANAQNELSAFCTKKATKW